MENRIMNINFRRFALPVSIIVFSFLLSGCPKKDPDMYYWGNYESLLYSMYMEAGSAEADVQIEKLTTDIKETENGGPGSIPPGVYAHLGFMYASLGKVDLAVESFNKEKSLFPESSRLIDGMMDRALARGKS